MLLNPKYAATKRAVGSSQGSQAQMNAYGTNTNFKMNESFKNVNNQGVNNNRSISAMNLNQR